MATARSPRKIAVVGAGVAGITAAYILSREHDVTLFEKNSYLGGHTNTRTIESGPDSGLAVDTGFIVCNEKNYPLLLRLFAQLGVSLRDSNMSFGFSCEKTGYRYLGPGVAEFLMMPANLLSPRFLRMFAAQRTFNSRMLEELRGGTLGNEPLAEYLARHRVPTDFVECYLVPLIASIWSSPAGSALDFPVATFARFFDNHGMLELSKRPQWKTVVGGSFAYVKAFAERFKGTVVLNSKIDRIERTESHLKIYMAGATLHTFDDVILATHADEAKNLLADPSSEERDLLGAWRYNINSTALHTDSSILPGKPRHWAAWNYCRRERATPDLANLPVSITYYMNRLQGLKSKRHYFVTLNDSGRINNEEVIYRVEYTHPVYTPDSVASQEKLRLLNGTRNTYYCGAYLGYGFHEDGVRSALDVCRCYGLDL